MTKQKSKENPTRNTQKAPQIGKSQMKVSDSKTLIIKDALKEDMIDFAEEVAAELGAGEFDMKDESYTKYMAPLNKKKLDKLKELQMDETINLEESVATNYLTFTSDDCEEIEKLKVED